MRYFIGLTTSVLYTIIGYVLTQEAKYVVAPSENPDVVSSVFDLVDTYNKHHSYDNMRTELNDILYLTEASKDSTLVLSTKGYGDAFNSLPNKMVDLTHNAYNPVIGHGTNITNFLDITEPLFNKNLNLVLRYQNILMELRSTEDYTYCKHFDYTECICFPQMQTSKKTNFDACLPRTDSEFKFCVETYQESTRYQVNGIWTPYRLSKKKCTLCQPGYQLNIDDGVCISSEYCKDLDDAANCYTCDQNRCLTCKMGYWPDSTKEECIDDFSDQTYKLANCAEHIIAIVNVPGTCYRCATGYVLNADGDACLYLLDLQKLTLFSCRVMNDDQTCKECLPSALSSQDNTMCIDKVKNIHYNVMTTTSNSTASKYDNYYDNNVQFEVSFTSDDATCFSGTELYSEDNSSYKLKPGNYYEPYDNQIEEYAEFVGYGKLKMIYTTCSCPDLQVYKCGYYVTNSTAACHDGIVQQTDYKLNKNREDQLYFSQIKVECKIKPSKKCIIKLFPESTEEGEHNFFNEEEVAKYIIGKRNNLIQYQ